MEMVDEFENVALHGTRDRDIVDQAVEIDKLEPCISYTHRDKPQMNDIFTQADATSMWAYCDTESCER